MMEKIESLCKWPQCNLIEEQCNISITITKSVTKSNMLLCLRLFCGKRHDMSLARSVPHRKPN